MPQVDLETLVCGGSDRKVACETLIDAADDDDSDDDDGDDDPANPPPPPLAAEAEDPDLPPESIEVPIGAEGIDWASLNAVYERDDSTKGNTNPKSNHSNPNPNPNPNPKSRRTNLSDAKKTPIIALPGGIVPRRRRKKPSPPPPPPQPPQTPPRPQGRISPGAAEAGAGAGAGADPGSPEVSCLGKVLSDRERRRRRRPGARGGGCWAALAAALGCGGGDTKMAEEEEVVVVGGCSGRSHARDYAGDGGLKRFASGRGGHVAEGGEGRWGWGSVGLVVTEDAGAGTADGERERE